MRLDKQLGWPLAVAAFLVAGGAGLATAQTRAQDNAKPAKRAESPARKNQGKATATKALPIGAEARLLAVIGLIEQQELDAALKAVASLTADVPNFQAAQLVYADLLRFKSGKTMKAPAQGIVLVKHSPSPTPPSSDAKEPQEWLAQLHGLRDELVRRVHGANARPAAGSIPSEFLALRPEVRHAIAVDASKSRLYLLARENGQLRVTDDFYVSIGKLGMGKLKEGDRRTPQGVYFVGRQIPGPKLPNLYGKGALTLNYPNDWDRAVGRTGSGIWLHGVPPEQFARLPKASDGCIVLANPDMLLLMRTVDSQTPVLVRDDLQWVAAEDAQRHQAMQAFQGVLTAWQRGWASADPQAKARLYSAELAASAAQKTPQRRLAALFKGGEATVQDVSVFAWKDAEGEIRIVNLKVKGQGRSEALPLRQYWRKSGERWQLFSEEIQS